MKSKSNLVWNLGALAAVVGVIGWVLAASTFSTAPPAVQPTGYTGQPEVTNYDLRSNKENYFRSSYEKQNWTGNVYAYAIDKDGVWDLASDLFSGGGGAGSRLDAQDFDTGRIIVTMKDDGSKIPFRLASLSTAQKTAVGGQDVLDYVRGNRAKEASGFRLRNSVLGDIMHSRPYYLANSGAPVLFVGANDGMLHVFDASIPGGGAELWAYVPSMLIPKLPALTTDPYVHTYYVDGGLNVGDAVISSANKKVLVSSLGAGGPGLFALDVTNPIPTDEASAATKILWEKKPASGDYFNMGEIYGTPLIVNVNSGGGQSAVITGNGYNAISNGISGATGKSTLYVINIADGSLIKSIETTGANSGGLSSPSCYDDNGNGTVDYCYAGDIDGRLWKFDLSYTDKTAWKVTELDITDSTLPATSPAPSAESKAITMAPSISRHPVGGVMVNFGTGRMFKDTDATDASFHFVYGIWDKPAAYNTNSTLFAGDLSDKTLTEKTYTYVTPASLTVSAKVRIIPWSGAPSWTIGGQKGWRVKLPAGERVIGDTVFTESGRFYFNSYNPTILNSTAPLPMPAGTPDGDNWLMELDYLTGGVAVSATQPFLDLNNDLLLDSNDRIKYAAAPNPAIPGKGIGSSIDTPDGIPVGRFNAYGVSSQPILVQLSKLNKTLMNQNPDVTIPTSNDRGVSGGHFDVDIFYGPQPTPVCNYNSSGGSTGNKAGGKVVFDYGTATRNTSALTIKVGTETIVTGNPGSKTDTNLATWVGSNVSSTNYSVSVSTSGSKGTITITANNAGTVWNGTVTLTETGDLTTSDYTLTNATGGTDSVAPTLTFNSCQMKKHFHEYDDIFNVTGVNMLNASDTTLNLENAISDANAATTQFKVLVHNQYLSPAVTLSVGGAEHISVKLYNNLAKETVAANVLANAPVYTRNTVKTMEWNMPVDAFIAKDWWALVDGVSLVPSGGDVRAGLHPTNASCVMNAKTNTGVLFQSVVPPANGVDGPGVNQTSQSAAGGVRHNGALTVQLIKAETPASAIEMQIAGHPEYGWRLKAQYFETYVIADWATYWHHPNTKCYGDSGWVKKPPQDFSPSDPKVWRTPVSGSEDPSTGSFRATSSIVSVDPTSTTRYETVGGVVVPLTTTVTVTTYADGTKKTVTRIQNADGTTTIITVTPKGTTTETIASTEGRITSGGDEKGSQAKTGRVSWSELLRN